MKKLVIQFEFPNDYDHDEIVGEINGSLTEMNNDLATELRYTILERK